MKTKTVTVNDRMQQGYHYLLTQTAGRNFDPNFRPELTPAEMLRLGVFGACGKSNAIASRATSHAGRGNARRCCIGPMTAGRSRFDASRTLLRDFRVHRVYVSTDRDIDKSFRREGPMAHDRIAMNPEVLGGKPVIRGTRIPVDMILRKLGAGMTVEEILADHPHLTTEDLRAAQAFAADYIADEELVYR